VTTAETMSPSHSSSPAGYPSISDIDKGLFNLAPVAAFLEHCDTDITPGSCNSSDDAKMIPNTGGNGASRGNTSRKRRVLASSQPAPLQPAANSNGQSDQSIARSRVCRPLMKLTISLIDMYKGIDAACYRDETRNLGT
jgi:hypothetical protein